jgi:hypothetical protein
MRQSWCLTICVACCLQFVAFGQSPPTVPTVKIINLDGHSTSLTSQEIGKLPHVTVNTRDHDSPARFEGVPLSALLTTAGIHLGDTLHGSRLTETLVVEAADGYKVVFALAEVDPAFAVREIVLADKRDGKPLDSKEGPFRIVAPGDKRPARWPRQVVELRVVAVQ